MKSTTTFKASKKLNFYPIQINKQINSESINNLLKVNILFYNSVNQRFGWQREREFNILFWRKV